MTMRLGTVLLAAGTGTRFGANKLLADYGGRPMLCAALDAMGQSCAALDAMGQSCAARMAVVVSCRETAELVKAYGYEVIWNDAPEAGQSRSVALGVKAMQDMDAVLLLAADQPRLTGGSLAHLIVQYYQSGKGLACLRDETHRGNPAVFSSAYYAELLALSGDRGAKGILRAHEEDLLVVDCLHPHELADADTPQALEKLAALG